MSEPLLLKPIASDGIHEIAVTDDSMRISHPPLSTSAR